MKAWQAVGFMAAAALAPRTLADDQRQALAATDVAGARSVAEAVAAAEPATSAQQIEELQRQIQELRDRLDKVAAQPAAQEAPAKPTAGKGGVKGTVQFYGHLDLSADAADKGISGRAVTVPAPGPAAVGGNLGWLAAVASNSSYLGVRGGLGLGDEWKALFQVESQVDVAATPGVAGTNFHDDTVVRGALGFRDSYLGFSGPLGAIKAGKSAAPYYRSTSRFDPFNGTVGTYTAVMGNTGGDNRVEFMTRMSHAIWYESPNLDGFSISALVSPGQNRNQDNLIQAQGEPGCTAGYSPTALQLFLCNDGAWGDAFSAAITYDRGPFYAAAAWELHRSVNRTVDEASYGGASPDGSIGIANEWAWKAGLMYDFPSGTRLGAIFEQMRRHNPYATQDYNERDRVGLWVTATQKLSAHDDLSVGWAHAGKTPGDVGTNRADGTSAAGPVANQANMYTAGLWHHFLEGNPAIYLVYATTVNQNGAHYDLGAGSHGLQYDCHDGNPIFGGPYPAGTPTYVGGGGRCWAGATLQAVSLGMTYNF